MFSNVDIAFSIYQIVEGMKYIHSLKIIHRDLKPSNILVTDDGTIKICDFSISKLMTPDEQRTSMTGNIGTLFFMAPEMLNGQIYDEKVDVFSFGILMFFLLSNGEMPNTTIGQCAQGKKAPIPSSFNSLSREIIDSCWNFDPKGRPSFDDICFEIEKNNYQVIDMSNTEKSIQRLNSIN